MNARLVTITKGNLETSETVSFDETDLLILQKLSQGVKENELHKHINLKQKTLINRVEKLKLKTGTKNVAHLMAYVCLNKVLIKGEKTFSEIAVDIPK